MASVITFLRTQGALILMGMLLIGAIVTQIQAAMRYRRLRREIAAVAVRSIETEGERNSEDRELSSQKEGKRPEAKRPMRGVRYQLETEEAEDDLLDRQEESPVSARKVSARRSDAKADNIGTVSMRKTAAKQTAVGQHEEEKENEVDSGLLQLKKSLERIAVSRDQKAEDLPHKGRILTAAEQKVIADILGEYLA